MLSIQVINHLIGKALAEAADTDAVKAARRFTFRHREDIYRAAALSRRALQLTETFPVLALAIYSHPLGLYPSPPDHWFGDAANAQRADLAERKSLAAHLIDRGARLRDVADVMNIPMALRTIKPGVAHWVTDSICCRHPELLNFMPITTQRQRIWLLVVRWAYNKVDPDFGVWAARHVSEIPGRTHNIIGNFLSDLADWARPDAGREFITRPFVPSMSLRTVMVLSADWHEAVASNLADGPDAAFPAPWLPAAKIGDYQIIPIEDAATLYREGTAMHHCAGTYRGRVLAGELYVYSIRRNGERTATLALRRYNNRATINQLRGACNSEPPKAITAMVLRWLRAQQPLPMRQESEPIPFWTKGVAA